MLLSKKIISLLLVLASVSLMGTGFSAWLIVADPENVATNQSTINVSNVIELKTGEVGIYMGGITSTGNLDTTAYNPDTLSFYKNVDNQNSTTTYGFINTNLSMQYVIQKIMFENNYGDFDSFSKYYLECSISYSATSDLLFNNDTYLITPDYAFTCLSNNTHQTIKTAVTTSSNNSNYKITTLVPLKSSSESCIYNLLTLDKSGLLNVPFKTYSLPLWFIIGY